MNYSCIFNRIDYYYKFLIKSKKIGGQMTEQEFRKQLEELSEIGIALFKEKNDDALLEKILRACKNITNADAGTLYSVIDKAVKIDVIINDSLGIHLGGSSSKTVPSTFNKIPLYNSDGSPNETRLVAYCALRNVHINVPNVYSSEDEFDFSGTYTFDHKMGYRCVSILTVPIHNHQNDVIAVLQLLNSKDQEGKIIEFSVLHEQIVESLASQAGIALTSRKLIKKQADLEDAIQNINKIINQ